MKALRFRLEESETPIILCYMIVQHFFWFFFSLLSSATSTATLAGDTELSVVSTCPFSFGCDLVDEAFCTNVHSVFDTWFCVIVSLTGVCETQLLPFDLFSCGGQDFELSRFFALLSSFRINVSRIIVALDKISSASFLKSPSGRKGLSLLFILKRKKTMC